MGPLPGVLVESSALDFTGGSKFWSLDDSGSPLLYRISNTGTLLQKLIINNANIRNWEDLAHDSTRTHMFIGDFGNNSCDRTNLRIFRIPYPSSSMTSVNATEIDFKYPDQSRIPSQWLNFDAESLLHYHGKLYIFTKADGSAIGYTKMYTIPDVAGSYIATLVDSFQTNDRTTSADISPDGKSVVLISNTRIHIFRNWSHNNFFNGTHTQLTISGSWTQKEGVCFTTSREIYLTDENTGSGNHLYYVDLRNWIPATTQPQPIVITTGLDDITEASSVVAYPNPANEYFNILVKGEKLSKLRISLYDMTGKSLFDSEFENNFSPFIINTAELPQGIYFYKVYKDAREIRTARVVVSH